MFKVALCVVALGLVAMASNVVVLTEENFESSIANKIAMVEFFAPWCGHCKNLAPHYEAAATALADVPEVLMGSVDATVEADLASRFGVRGYPTIKIFRNGVESSAYEGERTAAAIEAYLRRQTQPAFVKLDAGGVETFAASAALVAVAHVAAGSADEAAFIETANKLRDSYSFGVVVSSGAASLKLYRNKDQEVLSHSGPLTADAIESFLKVNSLPLVDEISGANYNAYVATKLPMGFLFVSLKDEKKTETDAVIAELKTTAKALHGRAVFVYVDSDKYMQHGERLGLSGKVVPSFAVDTPASGGPHWAYDESAPLKAAELTAFVNGIVDGSVKPTIKSAPVPQSNDGVVTVVVASQFVEIVMDKSKDVFIEFYAPWCGHCKRLEPIFESLGDVFADVDSVVIAKMDATANDIPVPGVSVQGFPTLMLFPAGEGKAPVAYEGDRSLSDMKDFIAKNAKSTFSASLIKDVDEADVHDEL